MLLFILAEDVVTTLGRIAAIVLTLYLFLFAVFFLVASLLLLYGSAWLRQKVGLLHNLRTIVENIDRAMHSASSETLPATLDSDNRFGQAVQAIHTVQSAQVVQKAKEVQEQFDNIEKKVEPVADRIAEGVIEFRARTVMAQGMLKAFFLPGLSKQKPRDALLLPAAPGFDRPEYTTIPAEGSSSPAASANVVIAQQNMPAGYVKPAGDGEIKPLASEGTERVDDAPIG